MKLFQLFLEADRARVRTALEALPQEMGRDPREDGIDKVMGHIDDLINAIGVKEDLVKLVVRQETDHFAENNGKPYTDAIVVDKHGDEWSMAFVPWGVLKELELEIDESVSELTKEEIAAFILFEMTFHGDEEASRETQMQIHETWDTGNFKELKPGILASPQVLEAMRKDPELQKVLEGLTFDDVKGKGKRVREE